MSYTNLKKIQKFIILVKTKTMVVAEVEANVGGQNSVKR
jgi:hypothetical protein